MLTNKGELSSSGSGEASIILNYQQQKKELDHPSSPQGVGAKPPPSASCLSHLTLLGAVSHSLLRVQLGATTFPRLEGDNSSHSPSACPYPNPSLAKSPSVSRQAQDHRTHLRNVKCVRRGLNNNQQSSKSHLTSMGPVLPTHIV